MTPALYAACSSVIDDEREQLDYQFSYVRSVLAETVRDKAKRPQPFKPKDFFAIQHSDAPQARPEMTPEQQKAYVVNFLHPLFKARHEAQKKMEGRT
ncbi:MAG: hypothetical protein E6R03_00750 [Hyphomicrobiaceae bacterium]|nr:MAG: hypothetical protein E6R03_00750 [Hyphomicrobiaceae bacterium]